MHDLTWNQAAIWALALVVALCAGGWDWRFRRIPNWLTVPAFLLGLGINGAVSGWSGVVSALEGVGIAFAVLIIPVALRGIGAGDLKLLMALGACLGPWKFLNVLVVSIFIAGIMAVIEVLRRRRVKETFSNLAVLIRAFVTFGMGAQEAMVTLDDPGSLRLPFGVAIAFAMVLVFFAKSSFLTF